jgi:glycosyltransferase involved in cell wall biosynthesis
MEKISAIVITYNEEIDLPDCLKSLQWVDEIIVIDSCSDDRTVEIAKEYGATVIDHPFEGYPKQKNYAFSQATYPWIINLDADERCTDELREEIQELLRVGPSTYGYFIYRTNIAFGYEIKHGGWNVDKVLRFFHRDQCRYEDREVHAELQYDFVPGELTSKMIHITYRSMDEYFEKFNRFTSMTVPDLVREGKHPSFTSFTFRPLWAFFKMYVLRRGFLDGKVGLILAGFAACYVFTKYAKFWFWQEQQAKSTQD